MAKKVEFSLTDEEYEDLREYADEYHGGDMERAVRSRLNIKGFRRLKKTFDPKRKKKPVALETVIPCAMQEWLDEKGLTIDDLIRAGAESIITLAKKNPELARKAYENFEE